MGGTGAAQAVAPASTEIALLDHEVAQLWSRVAELERENLTLKAIQGGHRSYWNKPPPAPKRHCVMFMARHAAGWIEGSIKNWYMAAREPDMVMVAVRVDDDDTDTIAAVKRAGQNGFRVALFVEPRPKYPGAELSRVAQTIEADFYHVVNDDNFPLEWAWDRHVNCFAQDFPDFGLAGWCPAPMRYNEDGIPGYAADYPVFQKAYVQAAGEIFTARFPFWFMDLGACHVYEMVTGHKPHPLRNADDHTAMHIAARKTGFTKRFRDYYFWADYFLALMPERVALAKKIAEGLGKPHHITPALVAELDARARSILIDDPIMREGVKHLPDPGPPDAAYLEAKAEAEAHMLILKAA